MAPRAWQEVGWIGVDSATCAFGDADILGDEATLDPADGVDQDGNVGPPASLVVCSTRADFDLPVEVLHDDRGVAAAARLCFTDDVDQLDGEWRAVGQLDVTLGRCLACDPYGTDHYYRLIFPMKPGSYLAEVFDFDGDVLALRIRSADGLGGVS
jgi:hypothetical protein